MNNIVKMAEFYIKTSPEKISKISLYNYKIYLCLYITNIISEKRAYREILFCGIFNGFNLSDFKDKKNISKQSCCGIKMEINTITSSIHCLLCGKIKTLYGVYFKDSNIIDGKKKNKNFDPNKHYKSWITCILGEEDKTEIEKSKLIPKLLDKMKSLNIKPNDLNVTIIRKLLIKIKQTRFNKNTSLIFKLINKNYDFPTISHDDKEKCAYLFYKVVYEREKTLLMTDERKNKRYYPYYIRKILEYILEDKNILNFIHLQKDQTLIEADLEWKKISEKVGIPWVTTTKMLYK